MSYYFSLKELRQEMTDSRLFSRRFETMLTFKLNSLKELCGRLPGDNEAYRNAKELHSLYFYSLLDKVCRTG